MLKLMAYLIAFVLLVQLSFVESGGCKKLGQACKIGTGCCPGTRCSKSSGLVCIKRYG
nr:venom peptide [Acharia stimulea]